MGERKINVGDKIIVHDKLETEIIRIILKIRIQIAIIQIRQIQKKYKKLSTGKLQNTNSKTAELKLLQAKEYYFEQSFKPYGKFNKVFAYDFNAMRKHYLFMNKLFPEKDFKENDMLILSNPRAITYWENKIFDLNLKSYNKKSINNHAVEIPKKLKLWKDIAQKDYI